MEGLLFDLQHAGRLLRRHSIFALFTATLLAFGIGSSTVVFSLINAFFLRPLPVTRPGELVQFTSALPGRSSDDFLWSPGFQLIRQQSRTLSSVAGQIALNLAITDGVMSERVRAHLVSGDFFRMLDVPAQLGRPLDLSDNLPEASPLAVVLSYAFWQRTFHGAQEIVGRSIFVQGQASVIVGVLPKGFNGLSVETTPDIWIPLAATRFIEPYRHERNFPLQVFGRLQPGVAPQQVEAECTPLYRAAMQEVVATWRGVAEADRVAQLGTSIRLESVALGLSGLRKKFSGPLTLLMFFTALLFVMVTPNLAGLLFARSASRQHELAIRLATGASELRLVRQMLTENVVLVALGGVGGLLFVLIGVPLALGSLPPVRMADGTLVPLSLELTPDLRIIGFFLVVCLVAALLSGLMPALQTTRVHSAELLQATRTTARRRGRSVWVTVQIALFSTVLMAAGLLTRTLQNLRSMNPGFDRDHLITFSVDPGLRNYTAKQANAMEQRLLFQIRSLPGVHSAAIASRGLMRGTGFKATLAPTGGIADQHLNVSANIVSLEYFDTMGMRLIAGRSFSGSEASVTKPLPVIVNERLAYRFFGNPDVVGRTLGSYYDGPAGADLRIVGVVSDAKYRSLREPLQPVYYMPWVRDDRATVVNPFILHVKTGVRPDSLIAPVRKVMQSIDPQLPFYEVTTMAAAIDDSLWSERLLVEFACGFGVLAAVLAGIGLYGVLALGVVQRTREIGIRMAIGARPADVFRHVCRESLWMLSGGLALAAVPFRVGSTWLRDLLYGVKLYDIVVLSSMVILVVAVTMIATLLPARRAAGIDPAIAMRHNG